jgi:starch phosphorylase
MKHLLPFVHVPRIAYFSMEIALRDEISTYSGGLGVLAGDTLQTAADLEVPVVGVTLASRRGYFRQEIDSRGRQQEHEDSWEPERWALPLRAKVAVPFGERFCWVQGWLYVVEGFTGARVPVILLDTDLPENDAEDRVVTHYLYGGDERYRLKQEVVLGIGGARMLQALGFHIFRYHMNEGHSALLLLELLWRFQSEPTAARPDDRAYDLPSVRRKCLFTTHTPVEAAQDRFSYELYREILDEFVEIGQVKKLAGEDFLNMTRLALNGSHYVNGVAKSHAQTSNHLFPGYGVRAITNGVHPVRWTCPSFAALYDRRVPEWRHEPELLLRADGIPDDEVWEAHRIAREALLARVSEISGVALDPDRPVIGFARRMTGYKRPELLFSELDRLRAIAQDYPFQVVLAGKAHPEDKAGKRLIEAIHGYIRSLSPAVPVVFLPNYDLQMALLLVSGSDLWLNTPLRPLEASGTSGMKAALNGVPNLGVLDGWWAEGCIEGVTGWSVGDGTGPRDGAALYEKLHRVVLPLFHGNRAGWIAIMKGAIAKNASYFNTHRMMRRYASEAYLQ